MFTSPPSVALATLLTTVVTFAYLRYGVDLDRYRNPHADDPVIQQKREDACKRSRLRTHLREHTSEPRRRDTLTEIASAIHAATDPDTHDRLDLCPIADRSVLARALQPYAYRLRSVARRSDLSERERRRVTTLAIHIHEYANSVDPVLDDHLDRINDHAATLAA